MDGGMEEGEIMWEVSPSVDYGMAICHYQIIIPPRDKQRMEAACVFVKMAKVKTSTSELGGGVWVGLQHRPLETDRL